MIKFLEKYDLDINNDFVNYGRLCVIIGFIMSTAILWATVHEAPDYFYIQHLIICVGVYILLQAIFNLVYFACKKIKGKINA